MVTLSILLAFVGFVLGFFVASRLLPSTVAEAIAEAIAEAEAAVPPVMQEVAVIEQQQQPPKSISDAYNEHEHKIDAIRDRLKALEEIWDGPKALLARLEQLEDKRLYHPNPQVCADCEKVRLDYIEKVFKDIRGQYIAAKKQPECGYLRASPYMTQSQENLTKFEARRYADANIFCVSENCPEKERLVDGALVMEHVDAGVDDIIDQVIIEADKSGHPRHGQLK